MVKVLVYDLISENYNSIRNTEFRDKLRAIRIKCTRRLHQLGVQCTESVILIPNTSSDRTRYAIEYVMYQYRTILEQISNILGVRLPNPIIRVLDITEQQYETFRELALRHLQQNIDANIDRVSLIIEQNNHENTRSLVNSLRKLKREWIRIRNHCISLGIPLDSEIQYLIDLIDQAITQLGG
jgi:phage-related holin